jgi:DNA repair exonuclease SbcCD ATPase subunit
MRFLLLYLFLTSVAGLGQTPATAPIASGHPPSQSVANAPAVSVLPDLDRLQAAASQATLDLQQLRIDKWKTDGESKRQSQANAESVQRNLTSALPGLIDAVRAAPQDVSAEFKLYRNLNVLYDVFASLTEATGAFGPRGDYEALAQQLETIDSVRRDLADALERLTSSTQSQLVQLQNQLRTYQQAAAAAAAAPPKKVIVDDTEPPKKTVHKKKKPAAPASATSTETSNTNSKDSTGAGTSVPKP